MIEVMLEDGPGDGKIIKLDDIPPAHIIYYTEPVPVKLSYKIEPITFTEDQRLIYIYRIVNFNEPTNRAIAQYEGRQ